MAEAIQACQPKQGAGTDGDQFVRVVLAAVTSVVGQELGHLRSTLICVAVVLQRAQHEVRGEVAEIDDRRADPELIQVDQSDPVTGGLLRSLCIPPPKLRAVLLLNVQLVTVGLLLSLLLIPPPLRAEFPLNVQVVTVGLLLNWLCIPPP